MTPISMATINTLGHSHTDASPGGGKTYPVFASSDKRTRLLIKILKAHNYDIAGLQEFQSVQRGYFLRWTTKWGCHAYADNAVIWHQLHTKVIERGSVRIPYFGGHMKDMPWVIARARRGKDVYALINTHNPANVNGPAEHHRREGWQREKDAAEAIMRHRPEVQCVFVVGDKNDPEYGEWVRNHGGKVSGRPDIRGIDWIAVFPRKGVNVKFTHHNTFETERVDDMTDHPVTEAVARIS